MTEPRCVVDTNVLISAALSSQSLPNRVVAYIVEAGRLLCSPSTLHELRTRLARPKFERYLSAEERERFVTFIAATGEDVTVTTEIADSPDPDDNVFLALALDGKADCIVTGDAKHLLPLHPFRGIPIWSPRKFAREVGIEASPR